MGPMPLMAAVIAAMDGRGFAWRMRLRLGMTEPRGDQPAACSRLRPAYLHAQVKV